LLELGDIALEYAEVPIVVAVRSVNIAQHKIAASSTCGRFQEATAPALITHLDNGPTAPFARRRLWWRSRCAETGDLVSAPFPASTTRHRRPP